MHTLIYEKFQKKMNGAQFKFKLFAVFSKKLTNDDFFCVILFSEDKGIDKASFESPIILWKSLQGLLGWNKKLSILNVQKSIPMYFSLLNMRKIVKRFQGPFKKELKGQSSTWLFFSFENSSSSKRQFRGSCWHSKLFPYNSAIKYA